jgi:asparagine synthase (glutamine-hydrolysing)
MCGILGFFKAQSSFQDINLLTSMSDKIRHRGPDQSDFFYCPTSGVHLAHQRLSIHDVTEAGKQPMLSNCGNYVIVFNGEIYNYEKVRLQLERLKSISWKSNSDTEVLLECIVACGIEKTLSLIDGMFVFAIYDKRLRTLTIARDRFGEKPLYLYLETGSFAFSSELRPIEVFAKKLTLNHQAVSSQIGLSYIPDNITIYNEVSKLLPGHYVTFEVGGSGYSTIGYFEYWSTAREALNLHSAQQCMTLNDSIERIEKSLEDSVIERMASDVPLGAFLSGGVDSTCIVALMQKNSAKKINTFSIGFEDQNYNEAHHAKAVAKVLGTEHHELYLQPKDIINVIPSLHEIYDEPFSDSSQIPTFMVSKFAKGSVTVALTGDAGDELFGGYNRHFMAARLEKLIRNNSALTRGTISKVLSSFPPGFYNSIGDLLNIISLRNINVSSMGDKVHKFAKVIRSNNGKELYENLINTGFPGLTNSEVFQPNDSGVFDLQSFSLAESMMLQDTIGYLRNDILTKVDRASMACSLETRVPFLSRGVFETAWSTPIEHKIVDGIGKYPLKKIVSKYVPDKLMQRPKAGFGIPIYSWLRSDLRDWAEDLLSVNKLEASGCLNVGLIRKSWEDHLTSKRNAQYELWNVLMFQQWYLSK